MMESWIAVGYILLGMVLNEIINWAIKRRKNRYLNVRLNKLMELKSEPCECGCTEFDMYIGILRSDEPEDVVKVTCQRCGTERTYTFTEE